MNEGEKARSYRHMADVGELQKEFILVDKDRDGRVDFREFKELLNGLQAGMSEYEMQIGFREIDLNQDGRIDCEEFISWWSTD